MLEVTVPCVNTVISHKATAVSGYQPTPTRCNFISGLLKASELVGQQRSQRYPLYIQAAWLCPPRWIITITLNSPELWHGPLAALLGRTINESTNDSALYETKLVNVLKTSSQKMHLNFYVGVVHTQLPKPQDKAVRIRLL